MTEDEIQVDVLTSDYIILTQKSEHCRFKSTSLNFMKQSPKPNR